MVGGLLAAPTFSVASANYGVLFTLVATTSFLVGTANSGVSPWHLQANSGLSWQVESYQVCWLDGWMLGWFTSLVGCLLATPMALVASSNCVALPV